MDRKSLLFQPSGQAATVAPSQIQAPLGAFGGGQGLSDLGQGIANAGGSLQRLQQEREARKQQDTRLSASASTLFAKKAADAKITELSTQLDNGTVRIDDIDEDQFAKDVDKTYDDELSQQLTKRHVPTGYAGTDEYLVDHGRHKQAVQEDTLKLVASIKETKRATRQSLINQESLDNYRRTGDLAPAFRALAETNDLRGMRDSTRRAIAAAHRESIEVVLPPALVKHKYTKEQRKALENDMVAIGWSQERAQALTKYEAMSDTTKAQLRADYDVATLSGDAQKAEGILGRLSEEVTPGEQAALRIRGAVDMRTGALTKEIVSPPVGSPLAPLNNLRQLADKIKKDGTGYSVLQSDMAEQKVTGSEQTQLRSRQSQLANVLDARIALLEKSPTKALEADPVVMKAGEELLRVLGPVMDNPGSIDGVYSNAGDTEALVLMALNQYREVSTQAAQRMGLEPSLVTPIPTGVSDSILSRMTNKNTASSAAGAFLQMVHIGDSSGIGSTVGRSLSNAVIDRASKHDDPTVSRLAPTLLLAQRMSLSGGANSVNLVNRLLSSSLDAEKVASAEKQIQAMPMGDAFSEKLISPTDVVKGTLRSMAPGTTIDTGLSAVLGGVFGSYAKEQTGERLASGFANMAMEDGIKIDKPKMLKAFSDWVIVDAATPGGVLNERALAASTSNLVTLLNSSGIIAVDMDGTDRLMYASISGTEIRSSFGITQPDTITDLDQMRQSVQAVADINEILRARAGVEFRMAPSRLTAGMQAQHDKAQSRGGLSAAFDQMAASSRVGAYAGLRQGRTTPIEKTQAQVSNLISKFRDTNFTFLFTGMRVFDFDEIQARFFPQEVLREYGFVENNTTAMNRPTFEANTRWFPESDGTMSKHFITGDARGIGSKMDANTSKKGPIVNEGARIPRSSVDAAVLYIRLQGTQVQDSFNDKYEAEAYDLVAPPDGVGLSGFGDAPLPSRVLKPGRRAPTSEEINVAFARYVRDLVAQRASANGTNHNRKYPSPTGHSPASPSSGRTAPADIPVLSSPEPER